MEKDIYEFNIAKHIHTLNGKPLTGVTTVLGVIAKPALIQWSSNENSKYVLENADRYFDSKTGKFNWNELCTVVDEAKTAHKRKKEDAGAKGTDVHAQIELIITEALQNTSGQIEIYRGENVQVAHFVRWAMDNKVKFLSSEDHIYSKEWFVGGICDFLCEIDGELWLGDIKTSTGIYPEHFFQTAAYQKMYEEMGLQQNFKGNIILNLRKDGGFEEKRSISNQDNLLAFVSALNLYRVQEKLKKTII